MKYGCSIHGYVLRINHVHLLLTPEEKDNAPLLTKDSGQRYVQYINRTYRQNVTLGEGRFRLWLTQSEKYVLPRRKSCRALFNAYIDVNIDDKIREATNGNVVPGNDQLSS